MEDGYDAAFHKKTANIKEKSMKRILIILALVFCFTTISEAKIWAPVIGVGVNLDGVILSPGESIILGTVPQPDYKLLRIRCINRNINGNQIPGGEVNMYLNGNLLMNWGSNWWMEDIFINDVGDITLKNDYTDNITLTLGYCTIELME